MPIPGRRANIPRQRANERGRARPERANTYAIDPNQILYMYPHRDVKTLSKGFNSP